MEPIPCLISSNLYFSPAHYYPNVAWSWHNSYPRYERNITHKVSITYQQDNHARVPASTQRYSGSCSFKGMELFWVALSFCLLGRMALRQRSLAYDPQTQRIESDLTNDWRGGSYQCLQTSSLCTLSTWFHEIPNTYNLQDFMTEVNGQKAISITPNLCKRIYH